MAGRVAVIIHPKFYPNWSVPARQKDAITLKAEKMASVEMKP
jgi:hypothetical protein